MKSAILLVFVTVFLAELGDKTQITTMLFATKYGWEKAFIGSALALVLVNLVGALIGEKVGHIIPHGLLQKVAGAIFIAFGILLISGKI
ncbi:TMEM165/GDT1 family protein [Thermococcus zilligii]|uniref:TMEM165/GDT1 family protein n=1 Tax=Thermococcus zilligii TaxID=54076 RepID=UPI00029B5066|nr:TMEM165/GDT1 family protein [Thermococcus zilligii]